MSTRTKQTFQQTTSKCKPVPGRAGLLMAFICIGLYITQFGVLHIYPFSIYITIHPQTSPFNINISPIVQWQRNFCTNLITAALVPFLILFPETTNNRLKFKHTDVWNYSGDYACFRQ